MYSYHINERNHFTDDAQVWEWTQVKPADMEVTKGRQGGVTAEKVVLSQPLFDTDFTTVRAI